MRPIITCPPVLKLKAFILTLLSALNAPLLFILPLRLPVIHFLLLCNLPPPLKILASMHPLLYLGLLMLSRALLNSVSSVTTSGDYDLINRIYTALLFYSQSS